jgi:hypothetical protein
LKRNARVYGANSQNPFCINFNPSHTTAPSSSTIVRVAAVAAVATISAVAAVALAEGE